MEIIFATSTFFPPSFLFSVFFFFCPKAIFPFTSFFTLQNSGGFSACILTEKENDVVYLLYLPKKKQKNEKSKKRFEECFCANTDMCVCVCAACVSFKYTMRRIWRVCIDANEKLHQFQFIQTPLFTRWTLERGRPKKKKRKQKRNRRRRITFILLGFSGRCWSPARPPIEQQKEKNILLWGFNLKGHKISFSHSRCLKGPDRVTCVTY